jgi:hypothetical protein
MNAFRVVAAPSSVGSGGDVHARATAANASVTLIDGSSAIRLRRAVPILVGTDAAAFDGGLSTSQVVLHASFLHGTYALLGRMRRVSSP